MLSTVVAVFGLLAGPSVAQQIYDIWETAYDESVLFQRQQPSYLPIDFVTPGAIGQADIVVSDGTLYQDIDGFGAALTDSAALTLSQLKSANAGNYNNLLNTLFSPTDGAATAGLTFVRVPLGASDFSASVYSYNDQDDTSLAEFNINVAPSYLWSTLSDIYAVNSQLKIIIAPWSPPGWMTSTGTMLGGTFLSQYTDTLANYLLKSVQAISAKGLPIYAVSVQNEPQNSNPSYPTCVMSASQEAAVAAELRTLLNNAGFSSVQIFALEHNWNLATSYAVPTVEDSPSSFAGASFHCYSGDYENQLDFQSAEPSKSIWFTECTGTIGSVWWSDIKWNMQNLAIGSINDYSRSVLFWNLAGNTAGGPILPGSNSCGSPGCRPVVTVDGGSYTLNQEYYVLAQASRAIVPKDSDGPFGQRIGVSVGGGSAGELQVSAFKTERGASADTDWNRYSLVVMNWQDGESGGSAAPVTTTIEFRGAQATYDFPVGVTTLWWFAEN